MREVTPASGGMARGWRGGFPGEPCLDGWRGRVSLCLLSKEAIACPPIPLLKQGETVCA